MTAPLSPYPLPFLNGASVDLPANAGPIGGLLDQAGRRNIDTLSVYGLESWTSPARQSLLAQITGRGFQVVPRIEGYDPAAFAFRSPADVDAVTALYGGSFPGDLRAVAPHIPYVLVNMPVDDQRVTARLGGQGARWEAAQVAYATGIVGKLRTLLGGIPLYLGVFYGWDGSYDLPSYAGAGADGYVLTSYSYPAGSPAGVGDAEDRLVDAARLRRVADRLVRQYPGAPTVVEYGFQTMAGHASLPGQTAGLVLDRPAKRKALLATTRLYRDGYPQVRGTMYFGLNVVKQEGSPPVTLDWSLI